MRSNDTLAQRLVRLLTFGLLLAAVSVRGQEESKAPVRNITIKSEPAGALVLLSGEHRFAGRTPFILPYHLAGKYRISTNKRGYESFRAEYNFSSSTKGLLMLKLDVRTAGSAALRSFVAPGWGQFYSERKKWGLLWVGATTGSLAAFVVNELNYRDAQNDHRAALKALQNGPYSAQQKDAFDSALRRVNNAEDDRNLSLYILGGAWALNLLDSVIFFPNHADNSELFRRASFGLSQRGDAAKLNLKIALDKR